jgi:hypothetical protein
MKILTITCLVAVLLSAAPAYKVVSKTTGQRGIALEDRRLTKWAPFPPTRLEGLLERERYLLSEGKLRDYLLPSLHSADLVKEWIEKARKNPYEERKGNYSAWIPSRMDGWPHLHSDDSPSSRLSVKAGETQNFTNGVEEAWVSHYASGLATAYDRATAVTVDGAGNVYVTGYSSNSSFGVDYITVKYDGSGVQVWIAMYNGPGNGDDIATALAVDASGNVYVTGRSYGSGTGYDYATVKYNSAGVQQWVARYNGPGNSWDRASALAVDGSGNVYVTGYSEGYGWRVYTTIKYVQTPVSVKDETTDMPCRYWLLQNYPNPFNPPTCIQYQLPKSAHVLLSIYNLLGEKIHTVVDEFQTSGRYKIEFQANNLASGLYFYQLRAGDFVETKRMLLLK